VLNDIFRDFLMKFVTVYMVDVCVDNRMVEEHLRHVRRVLQRFKEEGLTLRLQKYFFGLPETEYLGYTVSGGKGSISTQKANVIKD
jgi:hypothetical protein